MQLSAKLQKFSEYCNRNDYTTLNRVCIDRLSTARDGPGRLPRPRPIRPIPMPRPRGRRSAEPRRTGQD